VRYRVILKQFIGIGVLFAAASAQPLASPQEAETSSNRLPVRLPGVHLYDVTLYESYYSSLLSSGSSTGYDLTTGGGATLGWARTRHRSNFFLNYTATYIRDFSRPEFNSLNHGLSFGFSRKLRGNWSFRGGTVTEVMNTTQFLFQPNLFSQVTERADTADELAAALLRNSNFDNAYLAALLTGAPVLESPARQLFFGDRVLNAAFQSSLAYKRPRLSVVFSTCGTHIQNLAGSSGQTAQSAYVVPTSNSVRGGVSLSYSLSPRTEVGFYASSQRTLSRFEDVYISTAAATFGRRMSERWFFEVHGGTGFFQPIRSTSQLPTGPQYVAGGGLGFKTQSHSFLLSVDRNIDDVYGFGATSNLNTTAAWSWGRRGRGWKILGSGSRQQIHTAGFQDIDAWLLSTGFSRRTSSRTSLNVTYAYMCPGAATGLMQNKETHAVRMAFLWTPSAPY